MDLHAAATVQSRLVSLPNIIPSDSYRCKLDPDKGCSLQLNISVRRVPAYRSKFSNESK